MKKEFKSHKADNNKKIHRFYIPNLQENIETGKEIILQDKGLLNQLLNVFRFKSSDKFIIFTDDGFDYFLEIISPNKKAILCKILFKKENVERKKLKINLAFSILKKENTEMILQKCTELGIHNFTPLLTDRTVKTGWNFERERKILIESTEQSGFGKIPGLEKEPQKIEKYLEKEIKTLSIEKIRSGIHIFVLDFGGITIYDFTQKIKKEGLENITILIGPEGGFSEREKELFKKYNLQIISFGENTLRGETAAIAISSILQNL